MSMPRRVSECVSVYRARGAWDLGAVSGAHYWEALLAGTGGHTKMREVNDVSGSGVRNAAALSLFP